MGAQDPHGKTHLERGAEEEKDPWKMEGSVSQSSSHRINAQLLFVLHEIPKRWEFGNRMVTLSEWYWHSEISCVSGFEHSWSHQLGVGEREGEGIWV